MHPRHFFQLVLLSAFWGASFPLIRVAAPAFGPFGIAFLRCVLGGLVLVLLLRAVRQSWPARRQWRAMAAMSVLTVAGPFLLYNSAALALPAGYLAVLNATSPLFGVMAGVLLEGERLTAARLAGCGAGVLGVALLVRLGPVVPDLHVLLAVLACVVAAAAFGFGAVLMKRSMQQVAPLPAAAAVHLAAAALLLVPASLAAPAMRPNAAATLAVLALGIVTSGLMYWLNLRLLQHISASAATSAAFMVPLFGVTWGALFLGEPVTPGMVPGIALVLLACALVTGFNPLRRRQC